jgi:hypothetical protein
MRWKLLTARERYNGAIREWLDEPSSNTRYCIGSCVKDALQGILSFPYYLERNHRDRYRFNGDTAALGLTV